MVKFGGADHKIKKLTVEMPEMLMLRDERGLIASTWKMVKITVDYGDIAEEGNATPGVKLEQRTDLHEKLSNSVEEKDESGLGLGGFTFEERERALRLARMEIQGALETVIPFAEDFRDLEQATTGILGTVAPDRVECEYCPIRHRNGDCRLPWVIF